MTTEIPPCPVCGKPATHSRRQLIEGPTLPYQFEGYNREPGKLVLGCVDHPAPEMGPRRTVRWYLAAALWPFIRWLYSIPKIDKRSQRHRTGNALRDWLIGF